MKNTLVLLSLLIIRVSTYAQHFDLNHFRGTWSLPTEQDRSISLDFVDSVRMNFTLDRTKGNYKYRIDKKDKDFIIVLFHNDEMRKDSFQISATNLTADSFQLKSIVHYYADGRPPESELYSGRTYILRKEKITSQG